jgi:hypothetical protein
VLPDLNAQSSANVSRKLGVWLLSLTVLNAALNTLTGLLTALISGYAVLACGGRGVEDTFGSWWLLEWILGALSVSSAGSSGTLPL